jgi:nitroimidazol reductase NimA-like FMN-containing flavoprotein (pyridoxamine 5'-phosphate oxidase superfamily)
MFRDMRRKKQQLSEEECLAILDEATSGVLAVLGDDDYPYGVPLSFARIGMKLVFHSAANGHKIDAMRAHPKASFTVIAQDVVVPSEYNTHFRSVIAFGQVHIVEDPSEKMALLRALGEHYWPNHDDELEAEIAPRFDHMHVLAFDIEHLTGKQSLALMQ